MTEEEKLLALAADEKYRALLKSRINSRHEEADSLAYRIMHLMAPTQPMEILSIIIPKNKFSRPEYMAQFPWLIPFCINADGMIVPECGRPIMEIFGSWRDRYCPNLSEESAALAFEYAFDIGSAYCAFLHSESNGGLGGMCCSSRIHKNRFLCLYYEVGDLFTIAHECGHALQFARYPDVPRDLCELYSDGFAAVFIQNDSPGYNFGHHYFADRARDLLRTIQLPRKDKYPFPIVADLIAEAYFALGDKKPADELAMMALVHDVLQNPVVERRLAEWPEWCAAVTTLIHGGEQAHAAIRAVHNNGKFSEIAAALYGWDEPGHPLAYPSADVIEAAVKDHRLKHGPTNGRPLPQKGIELKSLLVPPNQRGGI